MASSYSEDCCISQTGHSLLTACREHCLLNICFTQPLNITRRSLTTINKLFGGAWSPQCWPTIELPVLKAHYSSGPTELTDMMNMLVVLKSQLRMSIKATPVIDGYCSSLGIQVQEERCTVTVIWRCYSYYFSDYDMVVTVHAVL